MMKKLLFCLALVLISFCGYAQLTENFTDGDFTNNPTWVGGTTDWTVNTGFELQSNNTTVNSTYYLSTANSLVTTAQWDFFCKLSFNTSSANYVDVFLSSSASDLTLPATTGYFVRLGGTDDEICLYRKDNGSVTKIIDGVNGALNSSSNDVKITVIRDAANQWQLTRVLNATAAFTEGNVTDANYLTGSFFGILVKQSTASFFQKHVIDDITIGNFVPDILPPLVLTYTATSLTTLDILFNEPVDITSSQLASNYVVGNGIGSPVSVVRDLSNSSLVHLTFAGSFPIRTNLPITINGVQDLSGNALSNVVGSFSYFIPVQYDVVIDELMPDPDPVVGLPNSEWIELRNTSAFTIDLKDWILAKSTNLSSPSGPMPSYILQPDSFVIVCTGSAVTGLQPFGHVISVTSFPSLSNAGDLISLISPQGTVIHAVNYTDAWYQNELKKNGGWSLEMTDTRNPCSGSINWKASINASGGTPGRKNSNDAVNADPVSPSLLRAYAPDSVNVVLVFDEPMNATQAAINTNYTISDGVGSPISATPVPPLYDHVQLVIATPLLRNKIYTVTVAGNADCAGNGIGNKNSARVGLTEHTDSLDIVINEILFNPKPTSNDYVELYNRSNKILSLKNSSIANRSTTGAISSIYQMSTEDYLFFPGDFIVVTESKSLVLADYVANNPDAFIELPTMPSFSDDKGNVVMLNEQGNITDEVSYDDSWHFKLISNEEGVSLERIDYNVASQRAENWHSAATSVGYGTPTYKNSQYRVDAGVQGEVKTEPAVFSPDNDGFDDFATINYNFPEPGYVTNITIFDAVGRPVRNLQRNALSGLKGFYRWDGLGDKNQKLPVGIYIVYTEIFNLQGKTKKFKNTIVLAKKL